MVSIEPLYGEYLNKGKKQKTTTSGNTTTTIMTTNTNTTTTTIQTISYARFMGIAVT